MNEEQIQKEVREAVKEYVDELIHSRSGSRKARVVTPSDLMSSARSVRPQENNSAVNTNQLVQDLAATGMHVIQAVPKEDTKVRLQASKLTYGSAIRLKPKTEKKVNCDEQREPHWLTWPNTPDLQSRPASVVSCSRIDTPVVRQDDARPVSKQLITAAVQTERVVTPFAKRPQTPKISVHQSQDLQVHYANKEQSATRQPSTTAVIGLTSAKSAFNKTTKITSASQSKSRPVSRMSLAPKPPNVPPATPTVSEMSIPVDVSISPEPSIWNPKRSVASSVSHHRPMSRSESAATNHENRIKSANLNRSHIRSFSVRTVTPIGEQAQYNTLSGSPFVPALKQWVTNANDYERDVAYSLFQALGGKGPDAHKKKIQMRPKSAMAVMAKKYQNQRRAPVAGVQTTENAWEAYQKALAQANTFSLAGHSAIPTHRQQQRKPKQRNVKLTIFPPTEYTCESSFFLNSMVPFQRDFTINPEWTSEHKNATRFFDIKKASQSNGLRY